MKVLYSDSRKKAGEGVLFQAAIDILISPYS